MSIFEQVTDEIEAVRTGLRHLPAQRQEAEKNCRMDWIIDHMTRREAEKVSKAMCLRKRQARSGSVTDEDDPKSTAILQEAIRRADADPGWQEYHDKFMAEALEQRGHHR